MGLQSLSTSQPEGVFIEDYVTIEVGAMVEAKRVGEGTIIEINARICKGAVIGKVFPVAPVSTPVLMDSS